jgi:hypothetical protein
MYDVPSFIERSQGAGWQHFINDAGGSLCELGDTKLYELLSENTLILYIKASESNQQALIEPAKKIPKPVYYHPDFFQSALKSYLEEKQLAYVAQINPDDFVRWVFPKLVAKRQTKYREIAEQYGYTVLSNGLHSCRNSDEVVNLICEALD